MMISNDNFWEILKVFLCLTLANCENLRPNLNGALFCVTKWSKKAGVEKWIKAPKSQQKKLYLWKFKKQFLWIRSCCCWLSLLILHYYFGSRTAPEKGSNNESFYRKPKKQLDARGVWDDWNLAFGVTFVSVPGAVGADKFHYLQITIGYLIGYIVIAYVLLPLYYRLKLTSIYGYLQQRMGQLSYKSGAWIFIVSRLVGATARLYLVVNILQLTILDSLGVPFIVTTLIILIMIILYTYEGGVKTIVWTDTLQTTCMLLGLIICSVYMMNHLGLNFTESVTQMNQLGYTEVFNTNAQTIKHSLSNRF